MQASLLEWDSAKGRICDQIRAASTRMRILLKTRNEPAMLREWIEHHSRIVGRENLVIADNMSDDPDALRALEAASRESIVFRFAGFHNAIHDRDVFPELYEAVSASCQFFMFMDTDERLVWVEDSKWLAGPELVDKIDSRAPFSILPGILIDNFALRRDAFVFSGRACDGEAMLRWGKPVLSSHVAVPGVDRIHNSQFPSALLPRTGPINIVSLHLTRLAPEQRLRANRRKLAARRIIDADTPFGEIYERLPENYASDPVASRCVEEILDILALQDKDGTRFWGPTDLRQAVFFHRDGSISYGSELTRDAFVDLIRVGAQHFNQIFDEARGGDAADSEYARVRARVESMDPCVAEAELREAMERDGKALDAYGDPVYRKELLRLVLSQRRFEEAAKLMPCGDGPGRPGWHHILFARAFDDAARMEEAQEAWREVLRAFPGQPEAIAALARLERARAPAAQLEEPLEPRMSQSEQGLFATALHEARFLLEFGAGGSTSFAARLGVARIVSVESDRSWLDCLAVRPEIKAVDFTAYHVDIGPTGQWGTPVDPSRARGWPAYYRRVWADLAARNDVPDVVLVDGRFRVACVLSSLLQIGPSTKLIVHDFWDRPHYHCVLAHLDCIGRADTLGVFVPRGDIDWRRVAEELIDHALDVR